MTLQELVYKVQQLFQEAGQAFNDKTVITCEAKLKDLRDLLIDQIVEPDEKPADVAAATEETEQASPENTADETPVEPGPEAQPSED